MDKFIDLFIGLLIAVGWLVTMEVCALSPLLMARLW